MTEESQAEEIAKYKRVLSLARSSLEANQSTIAAKDQQIAQLIKALEDEKNNNKAKRTLAREEEASLVPRRILCRVDVDDVIWILVEYEECDDSWRCMQDEQDLQDFIQRAPGVPLVCPPKCLSAEESNRIEEESRKKVERIVEEFRRYKVRTEIAKKQKDAEARQAVLAGSSLASNTGSTSPAVPRTSYSSGLSGPLERALTLGSIDNQTGNGSDGSAHQHTDEVARLQATLAEQELKWKKMYEALAKENEVLRSKGGESLLATQWRGRYEACMKEKEELVDRLEQYTSWTNAVNASGKSMEQAYIELQEEFSSFRKKVSAIERRRQRATASIAGLGSDGASGSLGGYGGTESELTALVKEYDAHHGAGSGTGGHAGSGARSGGSPSAHGSSRLTSAGAAGPILSREDDADPSAGMTGSKIKYVRHMIFQYLSCRDPEVRSHMETALMTIFRMSPEEREAIESKRREETTDALTSITGFLSSLGT